jgi:hypothetical protein
VVIPSTERTFPIPLSQHAQHNSDIEISQAAAKRRIVDIAADKLGVAQGNLEPYGHYKAKVSLLRERPNGKLILVSGITPTVAGEGNTTTTVGLTDALNLLGKRTMLCLREPSLGPSFGMKGGGAGGGYAQVVPMEDIRSNFLRCSESSASTRRHEPTGPTARPISSASRPPFPPAKGFEWAASLASTRFSKSLVITTLFVMRLTNHPICLRRRGGQPSHGPRLAIDRRLVRPR